MKEQIAKQISVGLSSSLFAWTVSASSALDFLERAARACDPHGAQLGAAKMQSTVTVSETCSLIKFA